MKKWMLVVLMTLCGLNALQAQFYTGSNISFGRKRVQWQSFLWSYYEFERFDTYFARGGKNLALYTSQYVKDNLSNIENKLAYHTSEKFHFIIYNRLTDYKQSNIGYIEETNYNTGGVVEVIDGKIFLFFNGDYVDFERQIRMGISTLLIKQILYGQTLSSQIKNNTVMYLPDWVISGLAAHYAQPWTTEQNDELKRLWQTGKTKSLSLLTGKEAELVGQSLWDYIAETYGERTLSTIVLNLSKTRKIETAINYTLQVEYKAFIKKWQQQLASSFDFNAAPLPSKKNRLKKIKSRDREYTQILISPDGSHIAYVSNELGKAVVYLQEKNSKRKRKIYKTGFAIDDRPDYSFPALAWHPSGELLLMACEEKGIATLVLYNMETKKTDKILLEDIDKILSVSYDDQGRRMVMSIVRNGQSDIVIYHPSSQSLTSITNDIYDDFTPRFIQRSSQIAFASNRLDDTLRKQEKFSTAPKLSAHHQLFLYDLEKQKLLQVTNNPDVDFKEPMAYLFNGLTFLTDQNGVYNKGLATFDSVVTAIDTAIHYRTTTQWGLLTNYQTGIKHHDVEVLHGEQAMIFKDKKRNILTVESLLDQSVLPASEVPLTPRRMKENKQRAAQMRADSLQKLSLSDKQTVKSAKKMRQAVVSDLAEELTTEFMEQIKQQPLEEKRLLLGIKNTTNEEILDSAMNFAKQSFKQKMLAMFGTKVPGDSLAAKKIPPIQHAYQVEFYLKETTSQMSFSYLNATYQQFTGGSSPIYLNPGVSGMFQTTMKDLMENYRITAGVGMSLNLSDFEYLLSFENLEHRLGREVVFHRQSLSGSAPMGPYNYTYYYKQYTNEGYYMLKYPFNEVLLLKGTGFLRYDQMVLQSIDDISLVYPNDNQWWAGLKTELIYDHTRPLQKNIQLGTRFKFFGEYHQGILHNETNMFVAGFDFRHYQRIFRNIIFASRFAGSTSFGKSKLIYYMGGVDNWVLPKFNTNIVVDPEQNYSYQTLATNMRGFYQNIRNGNNFALFSNEVRIPVMSTIFGKSTSMAWLQQLQVIGFADVGTAWVGNNPWSKENAIYKKVIPNNPITVTIERDLNPIVGGIGWGLRTELFGYFLRADCGYGIENGAFQDRVFHFSFGLDF